MNQDPFRPFPDSNSNPDNTAEPQIPDETAAPQSADGTYRRVSGEVSAEMPFGAPVPPPQNVTPEPNRYYQMPGTEEAQPPYAPQTPSYGQQTTSPWGAPPSKPPKKKGHAGLIAILCVALFLVGIVGGYLAYRFLSPSQNDTPPKSSQSENNGTSENPDVNTPDAPFESGTFNPVYGDDEKTYSYAEVYTNSVNAVVGISTEVTTQNVFGQRSAYAVSGTGFIFSTDGYILTNCHIVEGATSIKVTMYDSTEYTATLVGKDSNNDVAVLKIEAENLTVLPIGSSAKMLVGEEILVIGNPLGELTYTLTRGIVSNLSREIQTEESAGSIKMFQTDAAINNGNSGGPALDCHGNVIGMVSAKYASSSIEGLGFCIPIDDAMEVARDLIEHGYVTGRAYLGLSNFQAVAGRANGQYVTGVQIYALEAGSCSEQAGIQINDVITQFNGKDIASVSDLRSALNEVKAGDTAELNVYRSGEFIKITVVLDEAKS